MEERIHFLQDLGEWLSTTRISIKTIGERLGWNANNNENINEPMVTCPFNSEHRIPEKGLDTHLKSCEWRSEGYSEKCVPLPEFCDDGTKRVVIDASLAEQIFRQALSQEPTMKSAWRKISLLWCTLQMGYRPVPQTSDRLFTTYTSDERRALYDYVVSQVGGTKTLNLEELQLPFEVENEPKLEKSKLELQAEERDAKRRRISYRGKKVSTNRKSYTEVMREVIANQMQMYKSMIKEECREGSEEEFMSSKKQQEKCSDEYESRYRVEHDKNRPNKHFETNERSSSNHHRERHKNWQERSSKDKFEGKGHRNMEYDKYERSKTKYSREGYSQGYYEYRSRSRERHTGRRKDDAYRESRDKRDRYISERRDNKECRSRDRRDKHYGHDDKVRDRTKKGSNSIGQSSKYLLQSKKNDDNSFQDKPIKIKEEKLSDDEFPSNSKSYDLKILEDMQRLLNEHLKAETDEDKDIETPSTHPVVNKAVNSTSKTNIYQSLHEDSSGDSYEYREHNSMPFRITKKMKRYHGHEKKRRQERYSSPTNKSSTSDFSS